jgi:GNAT superfamily N-acetyltransferase
VQVVTSADRPDLESETRDALRGRWPEFIFHGEAGRKDLTRVSEYFRGFDILLLDDGRVAAGGWGVPFAWNGNVSDLPDGYDGALAQSVHDYESGRIPTVPSFMAAAVAPVFDKQGLATEVLDALIERACERGIAHVVAPLRPTWKHRYPLQTMDEYAGWVREDGLSIDPWIRTHQRMGATILGPARRSMVITGTVSDWETWTGMVFPASGQFVVPDALNTVMVDRDADLVTYVEENLWVQHR